MSKATSTRAFNLSAVRADGWHSRLATSSPAFEQLCAIVGTRFVAFSIVAGARIAALSVDRYLPEASLVDFTVGNEAKVHRLSLADFRMRIVEALLEDDAEIQIGAADPTVEELQSTIGLRTLMLAAVFGMSPRTLELAEGDEPHVLLRLDVQDDGSDTLRSDEVYEGDSAVLRLPLSQFRGRVRSLVGQELERLQTGSRLSIDLELLPAAEEALRRGDAAAVVDLLQTWPALLGIMMRTQDGEALPGEVVRGLAHGMGMLSRAYVMSGNVEVAESVLRFGVQWAQDNISSGQFYLQLGAFLTERQRFGEAIGALRRAQALQAPKDEVLPLLAQCFAERQRFVAAAVCFAQAQDLGVDLLPFAEVRGRVDTALQDTWRSLQQVVGTEAKKSVQPGT